MTKDIFISHAWGFDEMNRDNHKRCLELYNKLVDLKFTVWFDEIDMKTNIDLSIINGIDNAKIILLCLTKKYCDKINYSVYNNMPQDNCYKEWNYSIFRQKYIIPVLMEEQMKDIYVKEKGIIQMYLNNMLYIDASTNLDKAVNEIINQLKEYNLYASITPNNSNNSLFDYFNQISPSKKLQRGLSSPFIIGLTTSDSIKIDSSKTGCSQVETMNALPSSKKGKKKGEKKGEIRETTNINNNTNNNTNNINNNIKNNVINITNKRLMKNMTALLKFFTFSTNKDTTQIIIRERTRRSNHANSKKTKIRHKSKKPNTIGRINSNNSLCSPSTHSTHSNISIPYERTSRDTIRI